MRSYILLLLFASFYASAQTTPCFTFEENEFSISGNAVVINDDTVRLTEAVGNQSGFVWSQNLVNFEQDFNLEAELYLGTQDASGADGIAFVVQPISNDEGTLGGGIGYAGISPSLAIEFDTWWNSGNDPIQDDHVALIADGEPWVMSAHSAYISYVGVDNLEDGEWHPISIGWDGTDNIFSLSLDGDLIFSTVLDIPNLFFDGNPNLYWGFTAATGGANNLQQVRILEFCSVDSSCNTPSPSADSPQTFCESMTLNQLQTNGSNIRFYTEEGDTLLDAATVVDESTTVYITQTIDDCESQTLVAIEVIIEEPTIFNDPFQLVYCQDNSPTTNLLDASNLFLSADFSGFFNTISDTETLNDIIESPENFPVTELDQIVYARIETSLCYEVYPIILIAEDPTIYTDPFEILYCQSSSPTVDLYTAADIFSSSNFSGFFNLLQEAENLTNEIINPSTFMVSSEDQMVYARVEEALCYEIYPIVLVSENCDIIIPEAISPNNDGLNDVFEIQNLYDVHLNHVLKIYNRYGQCIFEGNNNKKWAGTSDDGKLVPVGTYFYALRLNNEDNEVFTGWVYCNY